MNFLIQEVSFSTILPVWQHRLWPGRQSEIEPVSCINKEGKIDPQILLFEAKFFAARFENELLGVVSCHPVSANTMRIRGLFVDENHRNKKVGARLVSRVFEECVAQGTPELFGLVRLKNEIYFKKRGFEIYKSQAGYEFGPHLIMIKSN